MAYTYLMPLLFLQDATALLYVLFFVGFMAWAIMVSNTWWDPLPALCILLPILLLTLWLTTKMKEVCIQGHDTEEATLGSDDSDLSTKLLGASSNKEIS
jgi:glucose dehydrogenase